MEKFKLSHVALYAKGWYQTSDDIVSDLRKCLSVEDCCAETMSKSDIAMLLLRRLCECDWSKNRHDMAFPQVISELSPLRCHIIGHWHKDTPAIFGSIPTNDYDYWMAVIQFVLSRIRFMENDYWDRTLPDFKNVLPYKRGGLTGFSSQKAAIRIAKKMFKQ